MLKLTRLFIGLLVVFATFGILVGCENDVSMEKAGESVGKAVDKIGENAQQAGEAVQKGSQEFKKGYEEGKNN